MTSHPIFLLINLSVYLRHPFLMGRYRRKIGIAPVLWQGGSADHIPDDALRGNVAVKTNSGSGENLFVLDGKVDRKQMRRMFRRWMRRRSYGWRDLEWAYSQVDRRVFVEQLIIPKTGCHMYEVNAHACDGEVGLVFAMTRPVFDDRRPDFGVGALFDGSGNRLAATTASTSTPERRFPPDFKLPPEIMTAISYARAASKGIDYVRFDFFCTDGVVVGGEATIYPIAGYYGATWKDRGPLDDLNRLWDLRKTWFLTATHKGLRAAYAKALRERLGS